MNQSSQIMLKQQQQLSLTQETENPLIVLSWWRVPQWLELFHSGCLSPGRPTTSSCSGHRPQCSQAGVKILVVSWRATSPCQKPGNVGSDITEEISNIHGKREDQANTGPVLFCLPHPFCLDGFQKESLTTEVGLPTSMKGIGAILQRGLHLGDFNLW